MRNQITPEQRVRDVGRWVIVVLVVLLRFVLRVAWVLVVFALRYIESVLASVKRLARLALVLMLVNAVVGR